nr:hypothetical protein HmN_000315000 [Hymenolepis microstoma]
MIPMGRDQVAATPCESRKLSANQYDILPDAYRTSVNIHADVSQHNLSVIKFDESFSTIHALGKAIEPGPPAWQASILPLNHRRTLSLPPRPPHPAHHNPHYVPPPPPSLPPSLHPSLPPSIPPSFLPSNTTPLHHTRLGSTLNSVTTTAVPTTEPTSRRTLPCHCSCTPPSTPSATTDSGQSVKPAPSGATFSSPIPFNCNTPPHPTPPHLTSLHSTPLHSTLLYYSTILCSPLLSSALLCSPLLFSALLHNAHFAYGSGSR